MPQGRTVLHEGITITFGSWICVANGSGDFNGHLADSRKPEAFTSAPLLEATQAISGQLLAY
jgi:hypothetical protein